MTRFHNLLVRARVDPERLRNFLADWHFWVGVAYFGITATVVGLVVLFNRSAHEEAARTASARATATTQVAQCFTSVANAPLIKGFLDAQAAIIENSLLANQQAVAATRQDDPLLSVRLASIARLTAAKHNNVALHELTLKNTPTVQKCVKLAHTLGVDPNRYISRTSN